MNKHIIRLQVLSEKRKERMLALRNKGLTLEAIAKKFGLSKQRVWAILN